MLTVLQCQVSAQIAVHLVRDDKGGEREPHKWKTVITLVLDDNLHENSVYTTKVTSFMCQSLLLQAQFANT